jgi:hypothetical protein
LAQAENIFVFFSFSFAHHTSYHTSLRSAERILYIKYLRTVFVQLELNPVWQQNIGSSHQVLSLKRIASSAWSTESGGAVKNAKLTVLSPAGLEPPTS